MYLKRLLIPFDAKDVESPVVYTIGYILCRVNENKLQNYWPVRCVVLMAVAFLPWWWMQHTFSKRRYLSIARRRYPEFRIHNSLCSTIMFVQTEEITMFENFWTLTVVCNEEVVWV